MEKMLEKLMDYQKMEQDPRLAKMIRDTESRFAAMLSDDDLAFVNAAGTGDRPEPEKKHRPETNEK